MKPKKRRIRKILTALALIAMVVAYFPLDAEGYNIFAFLLAMPAEIWLTFWSYYTLNDDDWR